MKNNYLIIPKNNDDVLKLRSSGFETFLYPLDSFSVGFSNYFNIDDIITDEIFFYINKLLTSSEVDDLVHFFDLYEKKIAGIVFEDIGLVVACQKFKFKKILFSNHFILNSKSINIYLQYVDSLVISPDLTLTKINNILKESDKKLCIYGYGHLNMSYSRRKLLSNYFDYYELPKNNNVIIKNTEHEFLLNENDAGTVIYNKKIYNGLDKIYSENLLYTIVNLEGISADKFLCNEFDNDGFLSRETIYKVKRGE